jgi:uncharacterized peroxidase-related enzyme
VRAVAENWRNAAGLSEAERTMLNYAEKLTRSPGEMKAKDVEALRAAGWSDRAVSDIVQVVAYFNYINRIADGLGVELEPGMEDPSPPPPSPS